MNLLIVVTLGPIKCPKDLANKPKNGLPAPTDPVASALVEALTKAKNEECLENGPVVLADSAMNQHQARVQANAIAVSITAQTH
jgi:hypothetical protein